MPRKHLLLANFASLAAFLAVRGGAARAGLVALLVGLCPWACAKVKEASAEAALAAGAAVALVADAAATPARKTLSGGLEGMQGEAVVTLVTRMLVRCRRVRLPSRHEPAHPGAAPRRDHPVRA